MPAQEQLSENLDVSQDVENAPDDQQLQMPDAEPEVSPSTEQASEPECLEQHYLDGRGKRRPVKFRVLARANREDSPSEEAIQKYLQERDAKRRKRPGASA